MKLKTNETERLKALKRFDILDTPPDGTYDRITGLASKIFNMPIVLISLVDEDRIWFKSHHGIDTTEIGRDPGLCSSAILREDVYLVENAREDPRCLTNPLVAGKFGLQFYAAAPLQTKDGYNLGTFCIIDKIQRYINREQMEMLKDLAQIVIDDMELRLASRIAVRERDEQIEKLKQKSGE